MQQCRARQVLAGREQGWRTLAAYSCHDPLCPQCRHARGVAWQNKLLPILLTNRTRGLELDGRGRLWRAPTAEQWEGERDYIARTAEPTLQGRRARTAAQAAVRRIRPVKFFLLFVTLTVRNLPRLVARDDAGRVSWNGIDEQLLKPLRRMRETARRRPNSRAGQLWRPVVGGVRVVEVTYSRATGWHPHVHMLLLCDVSFIPKDQLKQLWEQYADGYIVDVEAVADEAEALKELAKYTAKPILSHAKDGGDAVNQLKGLPPHALVDLRDAVRRKRLIGTWGCLYGLPQAAEPDADPTELVTTVSGWAWAGGFGGWHVVWHARGRLPQDARAWWRWRTEVLRTGDWDRVADLTPAADLEFAEARAWDRYWAEHRRETAKDPSREWA